MTFVVWALPATGPELPPPVLVFQCRGVALRPVDVNGGPGALLLDGQQRLIGVWALDIADSQITSISVVVNPDKLSHLGPVGDYRSLLRSLR